MPKKKKYKEMAEKIKNSPIVYNFLYYTLGMALVGFSSRQVIDDFGSDKPNLNIGAGLKTVREDVIDLVADDSSLPLKDYAVTFLLSPE